MEINFKDLTDDFKVAYFLYLSEHIVPVLSQKNDQIIAKNALKPCWEWLQNKDILGENLYNLLDSDEDENNYGITIIQEMSEVDRDKTVWNCIIDAVAYTCRRAFENEGAKCFPEPIEIIDDSLIDHFFDCFNKCIPNPCKYIHTIDTLVNENILEIRHKAETLEQI